MEKTYVKLKEQSQKIEEAKHYLEAIILGIGDGLAIISQDYKIELENKALHKIFSTKSGVSKICYKHYLNRSQPCPSCTLQKSIKDMAVYHMEYTTPNRRTLWVTSSPFKKLDGTLACVQIIRDVTERIKTEKRYRDLFENAKDSIILLDLKGNFILGNKQTYQMSGFEEEEMVGKHFTKFIPPKYIPLALNLFWKALRGIEVPAFEIEIYNKQRELTPFEITGTTIKEAGKVVGVQCSLRDITERKKAEQEIKERNRELAVINAIAVTASQSLNLEEILNDTLNKVLEVTEARAGVVFLLDEESQKLVCQAYRGVSERLIKRFSNIKVGEGVTGWVVGSGEPIWVKDISQEPRASKSGVEREAFHSFAAIPLKSKAKVLGVMDVATHRHHSLTPRDIELLTTIGNQIGVAIENAQLYQKSQAQLIELKSTQDQLVRAGKLAAIGELAANIAHEVNNPLTSVLGYTSLLLQSMDENDPKVEDLKIIRDEAMRARYIIRNLLDFARRTPPEVAVAEINEVVATTLSLVQRQAELSNIEIIEDYGESLPKVSVDVEQMKQVFLNLIHNALYAMPHGGTLTIITKAIASEGQRFIEVWFTDTGAGISSENLTKVFDPFFTTRPEGKGTGLGLSISLSIVEAHGGTIEVQSELYKGSTFIVKLPCRDKGKIVS